MTPLIKQAIQIVIIDDSKVKQCDVNCGVDWSSAEAVTLVNQRIKDRFGDDVRLKYLDLSKPVTDERALELQQKIRNGDLSLPLLVINGAPRISGQFDIRMLLDAIDAEIEIKPKKRVK